MPHPKTDWIDLLKKVGADPSIFYRPRERKPSVKAQLLIDGVTIELGHCSASVHKKEGFYFSIHGFSYADGTGFKTAEECLAAAFEIFRRDLTARRDKFDSTLRCLPPPQVSDRTRDVKAQARACLFKARVQLDESDSYSSDVRATRVALRHLTDAIDLLLRE